MKRQILVTGGAGFIGSNFVKKICLRKEVRDEFDFIILDNLTYAGNYLNIQKEIELNGHLSFVKMDISDDKSIDNLFLNSNISGVINFAAESHVDRSIVSPKLFLETNTLGVLNLLNSSKKQRIKFENFRFLQISTDEVYGTLGINDPPFKETNNLLPNSPYSASKASADLLVRSFFETYKLPCIITRCSNNYGPLQNSEKLIPLMVLNALNNRPLPVYGNGENIRDWIFVDDHVEGVWAAFLNGIPGEIYNFGGNSEIKNIDLVKILLDKLNKPYNLIEFVIDRPGHDFRYAIDFSKANKILNWKPNTKFEDGIEKTIDWLRLAYNSKKILESQSLI